MYNLYIYIAISDKINDYLGFQIMYNIQQYVYSYLTYKTVND